jgi:hypothetical protein
MKNVYTISNFKLIDRKQIPIGSAIVHSGVVLDSVHKLTPQIVDTNRALPGQMNKMYASFTTAG